PGHVVDVLLLLALELFRAGAHVVELALGLRRPCGRVQRRSGEHGLRRKGEGREAQDEDDDPAHEAYPGSAPNGAATARMCAAQGVGRMRACRCTSSASPTTPATAERAWAPGRTGWMPDGGCGPAASKCPRQRSRRRPGFRAEIGPTFERHRSL